MKTEVQKESHRKASKKYKATEKGDITLKKFQKKYRVRNNARQNTRDIIRGRRGYKPLDLPASFFKCRACGEIEKLEIHHEIYPPSKKEIITAIQIGYIFMLCKEHHVAIHKLKTKGGKN